MKRSEAIKKIIECIERMRGVHGEYYVYPDDQTMAGFLLQAVEDFGMIPPYIPANEVWENGKLGEWERG
jgi:hypothetical protein